MKKMSLSAKLICFFLLIGLIPFAAISILSLNKASTALEKQAFGQLQGMREVKKSQITRFFNEREGDLGVLLETVRSLQAEAEGKLVAVQNNKKNAVEILAGQWFIDIAAQQDRSINTRGMAEYQAFLKTGKQSSEYRRYAAIIDEFVRINGYYDYFVIDLDGHIVHTQAKEADYNTNILTGRYKDSGLGRVVRKVMETGKAAIEDFSPYEPSNGEAAAFIAAPILSSGTITGTVALQISLDKTQAVIQDRTGLGKTGESYMIGRVGETISFRSNMTTMGDGKFTVGYDVTAIAPDYIKKGLGGITATDIYSDSSGHLVMVSVAPIDIPGLNWALITKVDLEEVIAPKAEGEDKDYYAKYIDTYGYYDLFLIHPKGEVFYTVTHESDYKTNMVDGKYADTNLGKLVRKVLETKQYGVADFKPYAPSNGIPAAFIAQPVLHGGSVELIVALQLSLEAINSIMQQRDGMGETGETYLVGSDKLMRSDSFLDPENHSVQASFARPATGRVDTEASRLGLSGKEDSRIIIDYNGNPVLSSFTPLKVGDITWALIAEIDEAEAFAAIRSIQWLTTVLAAVTALLVAGAAILIARSITRPINRITQGMHEGADQVASASGQVSSSSQSMAEGASEQAASIEETSSSMEEMSSMTRKNAENAVQADMLMKDANAVVDSANDSMSRLIRSMEEIAGASEETSKIIKTIDEIAFQTNLLALNAAVEAARAGEAGAGFAVVADEVRNLAMRAAEAAKNTSELIEGTVRKVKDGSDLVTVTSEAFARVAESSGKVGHIVAEISEASQEQSNGIEQVNLAITEMDKVVQQNAANAEESAAAAEEMNAQAEQLRDYVGDLVMLVTGRKENRSHDRYEAPNRAALPRKTRPGVKTGLPGIKKRDVRPDEVIPFEEDEAFKDF